MNSRHARYITVRYAAVAVPGTEATQAGATRKVAGEERGSHSISSAEGVFVWYSPLGVLKSDVDIKRID